MNDVEAKLDQVIRNQVHLCGGTVALLISEAGKQPTKEGRSAMYKIAFDIIRKVAGEQAYEELERSILELRASKNEN